MVQDLTSMTSIRSEDIIQTLQSLNLIRYLYLLHLQTSYLTQHLPSIPSLAILKYLYRILSCRFLTLLCMIFWNCCLTLLQTYVSEQRFPQFFLDNPLCRGTSFCFPFWCYWKFLILDVILILGIFSFWIRYWKGQHIISVSNKIIDEHLKVLPLQPTDRLSGCVLQLFSYCSRLLVIL